MYYYFYKITNNINGHFYYGVHATNNLEDGYMGSGKRLHMAYKKYGIKNFTKEILRFFDNMDLCFEYEKEIVNEEMIKDPNCYNIQLGGNGFSTSGMVTVKDSNGEYFWVTKEEYMFGNYETNWSWRHHSEESKEKIRKTMTPNGITGKRAWINKDGVVKYVKTDQLESYLNDNWKRGRTGYKPRKNYQGVKI